MGGERTLGAMEPRTNSRLLRLVLHVNKQTNTNIHTHTCAFVCEYVYVCVCTYICLFVYMEDQS